VLKIKFGRGRKRYASCALGAIFFCLARLLIKCSAVPADVSLASWTAQNYIWTRSKSYTSFAQNYICTRSKNLRFVCAKLHVGEVEKFTLRVQKITFGRLRKSYASGAENYIWTTSQNLRFGCSKLHVDEVEKKQEDWNMKHWIVKLSCRRMKHETPKQVTHKQTLTRQFHDSMFHVSIFLFF
jgi:hypothetical protein